MLQRSQRVAVQHLRENPSPSDPQKSAEPENPPKYKTGGYNLATK